jgi:hypothetical protein
MSIGPAPRVGDRPAAQLREEGDEVLAGLRGDGGVDLDAPAEPRAEGQAPAGPAERDPAVAVVRK